MAELIHQLRALLIVIIILICVVWAMMVMGMLWRRR
jgi:hypothetical protein